MSDSDIKELQEEDPSHFAIDMRDGTFWIQRLYVQNATDAPTSSYERTLIVQYREIKRLKEEIERLKKKFRALMDVREQERGYNPFSDAEWEEILNEG